jgi:DNA-binding transcriptional ArsR family regulator
MQLNDFETCAERLAALAEPTRLRIVHHLMIRGPACVTELARERGIAIAMVSHHLRPTARGWHCSVISARKGRYLLAGPGHRLERERA